jgi:cathepsin L
VEAYAEKDNLANASKPSVQQLVSCVLNPDKCGGDGGCKGATMNLALDYALLHGPSGGIYSEAQWPYQPGMVSSPPGNAVQCPAGSSALQVINSTAVAVAIPFSSYVVLPSNQYTPLLEALYESGPVGVSVAAGKWFNYQSGIFDSCTGSAGAVVDHAVVAVAFGEQAGTKYWTLMNSWGYNWGENGYIRLLRRDNDSSHCAQNHKPELGTACKPYPAQQTVCGMCGILFENVVPSP